MNKEHNSGQESLLQGAMDLVERQLNQKLRIAHLVTFNETLLYVNLTYCSGLISLQYT